MSSPLFNAIGVSCQLLGEPAKVNVTLHCTSCTGSLISYNVITDGPIIIPNLYTGSYTVDVIVIDSNYINIATTEMIVLPNNVTSNASTDEPTAIAISTDEPTATATCTGNWTDIVYSYTNLCMYVCDMCNLVLKWMYASFLHTCIDSNLAIKIMNMCGYKIVSAIIY